MLNMPRSLHCFIYAILLQAASRTAASEASVTSSPPGTSSFSCDINGNPNQTGLATQLADGPNGPTTITLPCSQLISIDRAGYSNAQQSTSTSGNGDQRSSSASPTSGTLATGKQTESIATNATSTANIPSSITKAPSFIRPTVNPGTAGCDIFGPIDQLGNIVVAINETSTTSQTTVPCSQYLSAQSVSLIGQAQGFDIGCSDQQYTISFGRSPECSSYANGKLSYRSECATGASGQATGVPKTADPDTYCRPPCFENPQVGAQFYYCCGSCQVHIDQVKVLYWPTETVKNQCARASSAGLAGNDTTTVLGGSSANTQSTQNSLSGDHVTKSTQILGARAESGPPVDVIDGFTYTYPSLYVSVVGTAAVSDSCGVRGATLTNPTPIAVTAITTISYSNWPSVCGPSGQAEPPPQADAVTGTLAISDIACPTWGLSDPFTTECAGSSFLTSTVGEPYNPIILAPSEILSLDPAWVGCSAIESTGDFVIRYGIYDPPRALQTGGALRSFSQAPKSPMLVSGPGGVGADRGNENGAAVAHQSEAQLVPPSSDIPESVGGQTTSSQASPPAATPQPQDTGSPGLPQATTAPTSDSNPPSTADPGQDAATKPIPSPGGVESQAPVSPTTINLYTPQPSAGLAGAIYSAIAGGTSPANSQAAAAFTPHIITALDQTLSINNPTAIAIGSSTLSAGGPAITSDNHYYSLAPSGNLIAGTIPTQISNPQSAAPPLLTFAGTTYTANSASDFTIAGQILTPGGTIQVANTLISLAATPTIAVINHSTQNLATAPVAATTTDVPVLTFDGTAYTANPSSAFIIGSQTLTPGGTITVSGTTISEPRSGGIAIVGSSTQTLGTSTVVLPAGTGVNGSGGSGVTAFEGLGSRIERVGKGMIFGYIAACVVIGMILV